MSLELAVLAGERPMARIGHVPRDDGWSLAYEAPWLADRQAYPLSPPLPLHPVSGQYDSRSIKRFIEHLLPEGHALDVAIAANGLARSNVFGLIRALGLDTAGVLRFRNADTPETPPSAPSARLVTAAELDARIGDRSVPFAVWDGKVRMSVAGIQDKLLVYLDGDGSMFLVDGARLASTHLLKPDLGLDHLPHLAVNEHFCMALARRIGLPAAEADLLHTPRPVLVVRRFDRTVQGHGDAVRVGRLHIVDACQACDVPVSFKYERNLGNAPDVRAIRDGVSFQKLFGLAGMAANKAAARLAMLRWALFQYLIGNSDAHGKNFSFFVRPGGYLEPAPWYDLVSVVQYERFDTELAMAFGDAFTLEEVTPFALADFAARCGIERRLLQREAARLAKLAAGAAAEQAGSAVYMPDERAFANRLATFVSRQAERLDRLARDAATVPAKFL